MAPIKFEENIREQLEKRNIQPSSQAWAKLSDRLDADESSNKNKGFWWGGIAASIALLIVSGLVFFNPEDEITNTLVTNDQDTSPVIENVVDNTTKESVVSTEGIETTSSFEESKTSIIEDKNDIIQNVKLQKNAPLNQDLALEEPKTNPVKENTVLETLKPKTALEYTEHKFNEVMAEIKTLDSDGTSVTDKEIDSLLNLAQKEILKDKFKRQGSEVVDAKTLLEDVEFDIEKSFRTRVFESIKSNYKTVKTAVAERNN